MDDEYQLEIRELRLRLAQLREQEADPELIAEFEAELRNLTALYAAACETLSQGRSDPRLAQALRELGLGDWTLPNVYSFVYDASMELDLESGRDLAARVDETDYAASLLAGLSEEDGAAG